jgi:GNAT superfamily N-acetyltransferase
VTLPGGYTSRLATLDDLDPVVALLDACNLADIGALDPVRVQVEETWSLSGVHLPRDTRLVLDPQGQVAAHAEVIGLHPDRYQNAVVRVHPDHRALGLGGWLLDWTESQARERLSTGSRSHLRPTVALEFETSGYVATVGVLRPWRGRGIARALIMRGCAELASRGHREVGLSVDATNPTGAVSLYEGVGMTVRREAHVFEKAVRAD